MNSKSIFSRCSGIVWRDGQGTAKSSRSGAEQGDRQPSCLVTRKRLALCDLPQTVEWSTISNRPNDTCAIVRCAQSQTRPIVRVHARLTAQTTRQALQNLNTTQRESIAAF